jgi:hypothetical protein
LGILLLGLLLDLAVVVGGWVKVGSGVLGGNSSTIGALLRAVLLLGGVFGWVKVGSGVLGGNSSTEGAPAELLAPTDGSAVGSGVVDGNISTRGSLVLPGAMGTLADGAAGVSIVTVGLE